MIVVDANVILHLVVDTTAKSEAARRWQLEDPNWHVPGLWRSEVRNALNNYRRAGLMTLSEVTEAMFRAESLGFQEYAVNSAIVLENARDYRLSAYDAEYLTLAQSLNSPLVTDDQTLLRAVPAMTAPLL